ncbi:hypothetical protein B0H13DRAFT_2313463 [Mycena leptocephala]|nr:hypothetical protein B0H13DRAFT_2313463 [Mycena leptocephala]
MCLKHDKFRLLFSTPAFAKRIAAFVVDEAHCISQWGDNFRTEYAELGTLRAFVPLRVPFMIASATLPPLVLAEVRKSMYMSTETSYHAAKSDLESLEFLVPPHDSEDAVVEVKQTMVFFDDINLAMDALEHLRDLLPRSARGAKPRDLRRYFFDIDFLFSRSHITDDVEEKYHATRFLALDDRELWELVPEFADHAVSFTEFTTATSPGYARTSPPFRASFLDFYHQFFVIYTYLRARDHLSTQEQSRSFVHAIPQSIRPHVQSRRSMMPTNGDQSFANSACITILAPLLSTTLIVRDNFVTSAHIALGIR